MDEPKDKIVSGKANYKLGFIFYEELLLQQSFFDAAKRNRIYLEILCYLFLRYVLLNLRMLVDKVNVSFSCSLSVQSTITLCQ